MFDDNRSGRRYACRARAMGASTTAFEATVRDLSHLGLCLVTDATMERGRQLHLSIELPQGRIEAVGEVRRSRTGEDGAREFGLRFVRISADALEVIRRTIEPGSYSILRLTPPTR